MSPSRFDRRTLVGGAAMAGLAAAGISGALVLAEQPATPSATPPGSPEASPQASPAASPAAGIEVHTIDINFEPKAFTIPANTDTVVTITNKGVLEHDFAIDELNILTDLLKTDESATVTINAPAGTYEYYCTVTGHKEAGMTGTLTVA